MADFESSPETLIIDEIYHARIQEWFVIDQRNQSELEFMGGMVDQICESPKMYDALCPELASIIRKGFLPEVQELLKRTDAIKHQPYKTAEQKKEMDERKIYIDKIRKSLNRLRRYVYPFTTAQIGSPSPQNRYSNSEFILYSMLIRRRKCSHI